MYESLAQAGLFLCLRRGRPARLNRSASARTPTPMDPASRGVRACRCFLSRGGQDHANFPERCGEECQACPETHSACIPRWYVGIQRTRPHVGLNQCTGPRGAPLGVPRMSCCCPGRERGCLSERRTTGRRWMSRTAACRELRTLGSRASSVETVRATHWCIRAFPE
jgi:hypothetical protein